MHQSIPGEQKIFSSDVQLTISNLSFLIPHFQFSCFNFLVPTSLCSDIRYTWFDHVKLTFTWNIGYQCEYSKLSIYPFKKKFTVITWLLTITTLVASTRAPLDVAPFPLLLIMNLFHNNFLILPPLLEPFQCLRQLFFLYKQRYSVFFLSVNKPVSLVRRR